MTTSSVQATHPGTVSEELYVDSVTVDDEGRSHSWRTHLMLTSPTDGGNGCLLVLVPGGTYGAEYWDLDYRPEIYSFVLWATRAGYSTANVDRVGSEASGRLPAGIVTIPANALGIHDVVRALRPRFRSVVLIGHSMGSWTSLLEASTYQDIDGLVLTGIVHEDNAAFRSTVIESLYEAGSDPKFAGQPGLEGYLTTRPAMRVDTFYYVPTAEPELLAIDEKQKGTATLGEVGSFAVARTKEVSKSISVPVLLLAGAEDRFVSASTIGPESPEWLREAAWYSSDVDLRVVPAAAHNTCLHLTAPTHHAMIIEWLGDNVGAS